MPLLGRMISIFNSRCQLELSYIYHLLCINICALQELAAQLSFLCHPQVHPSTASVSVRFDSVAHFGRKGLANRAEPF